MRLHFSRHNKKSLGKPNIHGGLPSFCLVPLTHYICCYALRLRRSLLRILFQLRQVILQFSIGCYIHFLGGLQYALRQTLLDRTDRPTETQSPIANHLTRQLIYCFLHQKSPRLLMPIFSPESGEMPSARTLGKSLQYERHRRPGKEQIGNRSPFS